MGLRPSPGQPERRAAHAPPSPEGTLCWLAVIKFRSQLWRHVLPWIVSVGALGYVFGFAINWKAIPEATENANLPLFIAITVFDKTLFFTFWAFMQTRTLRDFVEPVGLRTVLAVKGGAELLRTGSNLLADGAFLYGISQLVRNGLVAVMAVSIIPFGTHVAVLLLQSTLALPLLEGGLGANRDVLSFVVISWLGLLAVAVSVYLGYWRRVLRSAGLYEWVVSINPRKLLPIFGWFCVFAAFDLTIQRTASHAFGVDIDWLAFIARLPLLYMAISLPSLANFGTRAIAWSSLFSDFGSREALIAFALWTNTIFAIMHVLIGLVFFGQAIRLLRALRLARKEGKRVPSPLFHDAIDP